MNISSRSVSACDARGSASLRSAETRLVVAVVQAVESGRGPPAAA